MNKTKRSLVVAGVLIIALVGVSLATWRGVSIAAQTRGPIWTDPNIKGQSVSMNLSSDEKTLFVAIVDPQTGLRIIRVPTGNVQ